MSKRLGTLCAATFLSAAVLSVSVSPASAAEKDPLVDVPPVVTKLTEPLSAAAPSPTKSAVTAPPAKSPSGTSPGNTTAPPAAPDHGSTKGVEVKLGDQAVAGVGHDDATINDDDSTSADSQLLTLGGNEVLGAHADSDGENHSSFNPLAPITAPVCDGSAGGACLDVLYADADASDDGSRSRSDSRSGVAKVCLGGTSTEPASACDGPLAAGAANSEGQADRDQSTGRTTASSMFELATLCLAGDPVTGSCQLGASAVHSEGRSDSGGSSSSASRQSYVLDLQAGGDSVGRVSDPTDLSIQPECADPSLLCLFLNQGETYVGPAVAGHVQDALKLTLLPGVLDLYLGLGHTETLVHNDGRKPTSPPSSDVRSVDFDVAPSSIDDDGVLPNTGGLWSGLAMIGLLGVAAGSAIVAGSRRRADGLS